MTYVCNECGSPVITRTERTNTFGAVSITHVPVQCSNRACVNFPVPEDDSLAGWYHQNEN